MSSKATKAIIISLLFYVIEFSFFWFSLKTFTDLNQNWILGISVVATQLLSPKIKQFETQNGKQYQLKWLFLKRVINFK